MDSQKQIDAGSRNKNQSNKRQLTPEEQSLLDEKKSAKETQNLEIPEGFEPIMSLGS